MRRRLLLSLLACLLAITTASADSLYTPASRFTTLFSDRKAVAVGDVLHIIITESAQASQNMADTTATSTDAKGGPGPGIIGFLPQWQYAGSIAAQAKGSTSRSESLVARIAVTVVGLSPAGNLLVEGERTIIVHKDNQVIKITGEVRPQDIGPDSTVPSYKVANAKISYTGSNPARPGSKVGIITRLLHWLF